MKCLIYLGCEAKLQYIKTSAVKNGINSESLSENSLIDKFQRNLAKLTIILTKSEFCHANLIFLGMDGWMTWDFRSFLTIFQSYQDDGRLIMKGCVQWNYAYG